MAQEISTTESTQKPAQVKIAILLLYIYSIINTLVNLILQSSQENFSLALQIVIFIVNIYFVFLISKGKTWSRNLLLIFYIYGLCSSLWLLPNIKVEFKYFFIISAVKYALGLIPVVLLYLKPAKHWFETFK